MKCNNSELKIFSSLDEDLQQMIVERCCLKDTDENVMICLNHEEALGKLFIVKTNAHRVCLWHSHSNKRTVGNLKNPFPSTIGTDKKMSMFLFNHHNIILPFQSKVCKHCKKKCQEILKGFEEDSIRTPVIRRSILAQSVPMDISPSNSVVSLNSMQAPYQDSSQSSYAPSQELEKDKKVHLDALIKANKIDVSVKSRLYDNWDDVHPSRQRQTLNYAGAAVASAIQTIAPNEPGLLYRKLSDNPRYVEKHLNDEVPLSALAKEIVNTANGLAGSWDALKQYFSTVYGLPGINFKFLSQFNRRPMSSDSEGSDDEEFDKITLDEDLFFIFNFTYHLWISGVKHRLRFGHGMAPVIREKTYKWYYDTELCNTIFDFVVSPLNTQRNSYGVFNIKEDDGTKYTIGRVIRHQNNSDLVKSIQAHLRGLGMQVPSTSFLFKFLTYLPAASTKEMKGVNNVQEDAMRAFTTLDDIVENYSNKCSLPEDERINLKSCLSASKTYLKTEYYNNLSQTNPIRSHCVSCAVSDTKDSSKFSEECGHKHEGLKCEKCLLTYKTIAILKKLLLQYKDDQILSDYDTAVIEKRLKDSKAAIQQYQAHLIKVYTQEGEWQRLMDQRDPQTAFLEMDWGMKILPRRYRGKQSEWYGQNGMSNHISCFTRIVPHTFNEDGTPKTYRKQPDTYVAIVNDASKQDALTTAALVKENLIAYKKNNPDVKRVYLRSDCAGCYKCTKLIQAMYSLDIDDLTIMGYVYSAPCDGKSACNTYAAIVKHHLTKMVSKGQMDITTPRQLAEAISAASGIANVVVQLGTFSFRDDIYYKKMAKITDLNTIIFLENNILVYKQGRYGEGEQISMNKIPFPSNFDYETIGSEQPRRDEKQILLYRENGETENIEGEIEDYDDDNDELDEDIRDGLIYQCPNDNCDAEYLTLENLYDHQLSRKCFQKTKLRTQSIGAHYQRRYIEMYSLNQGENLTLSERRYKHIDWNDQIHFASLLSTFSWDIDDLKNLFCKGFGVMNFRSKNVIHDDVRAFVKQKFDEGESTKRHMSYPKIVSAIEDEKDASGLPKFFPHKWLDSQQVSYLITKFIKEKGSKSNSANVEPSEEDISVASAEEIYARRRDAIQTAVEQVQIQRPPAEQCHPILMEDGTNVCDIAKNYHDNKDGKASLIMNQDFSEILPILQAINVKPQGKNRRLAANAIVQFVKKECGCIPKRRKKNA